jgi:DNA polymerase III sliding clamp (beta) subunit (PCNA family)
MLSALKFVQGSVAKKDFLPALTHFRIENGKVKGFNGTIGLCSPITCAIDCTPEAIPLIKAIQNCKEAISLYLTDSGRLAVKSGSFKVFINCFPDVTAHPEPEGEMLELDCKALFNAITTLAPLVGNDASRPWSNGILFRGKSAFATNNIIVCEYWLGSSFPVEMNIPQEAIEEILRIGIPPSSVQFTETCITLHYPDNSWLRTQLLDNKWPDIGRILNADSNPVLLNKTIFEGLEIIKPFSQKNNAFHFSLGSISTTSEISEGASFEIEGLDHFGIYSIPMFQLLKNIVKTIDLSLYPSPALFFGDNLRGAIIGIRA